jgi:hypothetical protein
MPSVSSCVRLACVVELLSYHRLHGSYQLVDKKGQATGASQRSTSIGGIRPNTLFDLRLKSTLFTNLVRVS